MTMLLLICSGLKLFTKNLNINYDWVVLYYQPLKYYPNFVGIIFGENLINYPFGVTTWTVEIVTSNMLCNSIIYMSATNCIFANRRNFISNLNGLIQIYECAYWTFSKELIYRYNQHRIFTKNLYTETWEVMCGLPQSNITTNNIFKSALPHYDISRVTTKRDCVNISTKQTLLLLWWINITSNTLMKISPNTSLVNYLEDNYTFSKYFNGGLDCIIYFL